MKIKLWGWWKTMMRGARVESCSLSATHGGRDKEPLRLK